MRCPIPGLLALSYYLVGMLFTLGEYEPNDTECEWPSDEEDDEGEELAENIKDKVSLANDKSQKEAKAGDNENEEKDLKGIPEFWLTIFKNVDIFQDMVQEHDEEALKALTDISVSFTEKPMVTMVLIRLVWSIS